MAIDRWNPMGDMMTLRDAMDRLLQESFVWPGSPAVGSGRATMPIDVVENENDYVVYASLPGVKPENVQITVQGDTLTIRGEMSWGQPQGQKTTGETQQTPQQTTSANYLVRERRQATFFRQVSLPTTVNADRANARFEHGELIVTLPKAEEAKPKQIQVQAQGTQPPQQIRPQES
jgi:HSP20 family protein